MGSHGTAPWGRRRPLCRRRPCRHSPKGRRSHWAAGVRRIAACSCAVFGDTGRAAGRLVARLDGLRRQEQRGERRRRVSCLIGDLARPAQIRCAGCVWRFKSPMAVATQRRPSVGGLGSVGGSNSSELPGLRGRPSVMEDRPGVRSNTHVGASPEEPLDTRCYQRRLPRRSRCVAGPESLPWNRLGTLSIGCLAGGGVGGMDSREVLASRARHL